MIACARPAHGEALDSASFRCPPPPFSYRSRLLARLAAVQPELRVDWQTATEVGHGKTRSRGGRSFLPGSSESLLVNMFYQTDLPCASRSQSEKAVNRKMMF